MNRNQHESNHINPHHSNWFPFLDHPRFISVQDLGVACLSTGAGSRAEAQGFPSWAVSLFYRFSIHLRTRAVIFLVAYSVSRAGVLMLQLSQPAPKCQHFSILFHTVPIFLDYNIND
jgi:hypothetical protein